MSHDHLFVVPRELAQSLFRCSRYLLRCYTQHELKAAGCPDESFVTNASLLEPVFGAWTGNAPWAECALHKCLADSGAILRNFWPLVVPGSPGVSHWYKDWAESDNPRDCSDWKRLGTAAQSSPAREEPSASSDG
eukprot:CAMPEP_0175808914 /NCGR_PEP_ID=MMETSP0107_2-20121207/2515_1 /TAXON_ID=195067 ORGANISM="Goniomonas pacifica, Strain CCMP1869" /NCGR_SAMPLE_ID=MMETSP0107_2 /ASSEMBLY_ACC=CAM_ASM_000203 /LENGTH=134 /DNA_ID=CAMNT_0017120577 /DNA_START=251 /DNA_END=655 /DNA_ORIENTATION=-